MPDVELKQVSRRFGSVLALQSIDLEVEKGELLCLLGPSGCGKTTLLRIIAGLLHPDFGRVLICGKDVTRLPPYDRNIGMVFQSYALFPHMTVTNNIAFGLRSRRIKGPEASRRIAWAIDFLHLDGLERRYPHQLSGGQQQRVALARAVVLNPSVLLLDEPLSNLDARLRQQVRQEIRRVQRDLGIATVFVTHDQEEALTLADRIVVLKDGKAVQVGKPLELYLTPSSLFVANFLGDSNVLHGHVRLELAGLSFTTEQGLLVRLGSRAFNGEDATLVLRPETIELSRDRITMSNAFAGVIETNQYRGPTVEFWIATTTGDRLRVLKTLPGYQDFRAGEQVWVGWDESRGVLLPVGQSQPRPPVLT